jgi:hypothetical protein
MNSKAARIRSGDLRPAECLEGAVHRSVLLLVLALASHLCGSVHLALRAAQFGEEVSLAPAGDHGT